MKMEDFLPKAVLSVFSQIEIVEQEIAEWKDHENFRVINASLMPYRSEILSDCPEWLFRDHVQEVAKRLSEISPYDTKSQIESKMIGSTDAEIVKVVSNVSEIIPIRGDVADPCVRIFARICKRQGIKHGEEYYAYKDDMLDYYESELRKEIQNKTRAKETWKVVKSIRSWD